MNVAFYVSQEAFDKLKQSTDGEVTGEPTFPSLRTLVGVPIHVSSYLPMRKKTGQIKQLDPFVTYEKGDMDWAEPLGLAAWEEELCHVIKSVSSGGFIDGY